MKLCLITGGTSAERGISLNSARSCYDHLDKSLYDLTILYINPKLEWYQIADHQLYSNTPLDFDYQLHISHQALSTADRDRILQAQDYVLPIIHGAYGEDGQIQSLLESLGVSYLGSSAQACQVTSDKYQIQQTLQAHDFYTLGNSHIIRQGEDLPMIPEGKRVVKPLHGGSSIGVYIFDNLQSLHQGLANCFVYESACILEPYCTGQEFTILVLENADHQPVALLPTQIVFHRDSLFDYRKKYLATSDTAYYTPAQWGENMIASIRSQAEKVFGLFAMKDVVRLDGRLMPDGQIRRSDINRMSGMEQNSFLFQQSSLLGWTHQDTLHYLIHKTLPSPSDHSHKQIIPVVFGGKTAERQVSILSGTNVVMKLLYSQLYYPKPIFMDHQGNLFEIPFQLCLLHTVEEIQEKIGLYQNPNYLEMLFQYQHDINTQLATSGHDNPISRIRSPQATTRAQIGQYSGFVFLGLHGGEGENGTIQHILDDLHISYNGPSAAVSVLCANKILTKHCIDDTHIPGVSTAKFIGYQLHLLEQQAHRDIVRNQIQEDIGPGPYIIKPADDGCSAGVIKFENRQQWEEIIGRYRSGQDRIPAHTLYDHPVIPLPSIRFDKVLIEEYIVSDEVSLHHLDIERTTVSNMVECTIGVIGHIGSMYVFNPSQTIASQAVLSMEEKFMGGTGINLTPPPPAYMSTEVIDIVKKRVGQVVAVLGIGGYSRIDLFIDRLTGDCIIIEVNTLPALTPSTVLFHQGLAEKPALTPGKLIESLINHSMTHH